MKKLCINLIILLFPVFAIIMILPVEKRLKYSGLKNDCFNHAIWIYDRIFNNKKPVDIAFLGSSHVINGVNDELIEMQLGDNNLNITNFGYCRLGRDLSYTLVKDIIEEKKPTHIIIEVLEDEDRYSHPVFPHISDSYDVLFSHLLFNRDYISNLFTHMSYKIELFQDKLFKTGPFEPMRHENFGGTTSPDTASFDFLEKVRQMRSVRKPGLKKTERDFHMKFPRFYLKRVSRLCSQNGIDLTFLYIPAYGTYIKKPLELETYLKYGEILYTPEEIQENPSNWYDENHLNVAGSEKLSLWLSDEIVKKWVKSESVR